MRLSFRPRRHACLRTASFAVALWSTVMSGTLSDSARLSPRDLIHVHDEGGIQGDGAGARPGTHPPDPTHVAMEEETARHTVPHVTMPEWDRNITRQIQAMLNAKALLWNTSFSVAVQSRHGLLRVAAGIDNHATGKRATPHTLVPMGSVTKPFTAAGILRLVEAGSLSLDEPVASRLDPALMAWNGTRLAELFPQSAAAVNRITIRQLLRMQSGMNDYDDLAVQQWTYTHPSSDYSPFDFLATMNKTLVCEPGTCGCYSSIGYQLLGLLLAWESGSRKWSDFDQLSVLPHKLQKRLRALGIRFPLFGPCAQYPDITHQYAAWHVEDEPHQLHFFDIDNASCLNGWTCGNIAAAPAAIATYFYELFHGRVVSKKILAEMQEWKPFTVGYSIGSRYGLGLFFENYFPTADGRGVVNETATIGHGGMDWGSGASPAGYNKQWDFGIAFAVGAVTGINCSLPDVLTNGNAWQDALCPVYDLVLQHASDGTAPRLDCTWQPAQDWDYGFTSDKPVKCNYTRPDFDMPPSPNHRLRRT
eukprot:m.53450 g.53450  ORF g.53450 m.53450 type:complete len:533 (+) comp7460_c0_seq1:95-1693(+)